ncbi:DUF397 domain-containing protein [Kitasatospora sp. NPDC001683]|uniref:DUF397 domain-containing protein n=2 Tax=Kitasatospora cathayae TaxID=3004092 RepID=A0ABY7QD07_9ACTN|nr:DUF397 domain-containing protein [Kitasatospora sp. HUAS 3-15]WBP89991.1 DUF397 domain-containing protein [Kitasatospora sp. HUAS 3-15]
MTMPEISAQGWRKSSFSPQASECVETGHVTTGGMAVRDSKDPHGPALVFPAAAWTAFVSAVKTGELPNT